LWGVLIGWVSGGAAVGIGSMVVMQSGLFDIRASTPHLFVVGWLTHHTMIRSVQVRAASDSGRRFMPEQIARGFRLYDSHCFACHGGPGLSRERWVDGLTPTAPYLLDMARQWSPSQLHLIVADGIKMTGMPAWKFTLADGEIWDVVRFVRAMHGMSPARYLQMRATAASGGESALGVANYAHSRAPHPQ